MAAIMKAVGFRIFRRNPPGSLQSLTATYWRMEGSINRPDQRRNIDAFTSTTAQKMNDVQKIVGFL
ncbi:hypothetical protein [Desulfosarcina cetonica]|uniref:hypothetical protein n=1 Tax=Desulfosarcina cetonica TaxID=90730 RepID=UPI0006D1B277|nr:hypothetical protein [Desulfosarcina cetonica]